MLRCCAVLPEDGFPPIRRFSAVYTVDELFHNFLRKEYYAHEADAGMHPQGG